MRQTRLLKLSDIVIQKAVSSTELKKQYEINVNRQKPCLQGKRVKRR